MLVSRAILTGLAASLLAACGGGGGGDGNSGATQGGTATPPPVSTPSPVDNSWLQLTPAAIELSQYAGEPVTFTVDAKSTKMVSQAFNVGVIDANGTIETTVRLDPVSLLEYKVQLSTAKTLAPGAYQTSIEVRLCEDDPRTCAKPIPGSPWKLPLKVVVKPLRNLTPISRLPQLAPWTNFQGNAQHSGYVPLSVDPARIERRWILTMPGRYSGLGNLPSMAIEDGQVFFLTNSGAAADGGWSLHAVDETTGFGGWTTPLSSFGSVDSPSAGSGLVVLTANRGNSGTLLTVDQKTGAIARQIALPDRAATFSGFKPAPTVSGTSVYLSQGRLNGVASYDLASGALRWAQDWQQYGQNWSPAVRGDRVIATQDSGGFRVFDAQTGAPSMTIGDFMDSRSFVTPVLSTTDMAYVVPNNIGPVAMGAYDLAQQKRLWLAPTEAMPVTDGKVVYTLDAGKIVARDARTGVEQWSLAVPGMGRASLLLTDTVLFYSASDPNYRPVTVAVDLARRAIVWTHPQGGTMGLSDRGVLYILTHGASSLQAINLR